jgi:hypothetical protein
MSRPFDKRLKYTLTINSVVYVLTITPSNNLGIEYSRSDRYFGVIRTLTASLEFKYDQGNYIGGAQQLIDAFETDGIWAQASLLIQIRDTQNPMTYNNFFRGVADFSSIEIERNYVKMKFIESNDVKKLFTRDEIDINLNTLQSLDNTAITNYGLYKTTNIKGQTIFYEGLIKGILASESAQNMAANTSALWFDETQLSFGIEGIVKINDSGQLLLPSSTDSKIYTNNKTTQITVSLSFLLQMAITVNYIGSGTFGAWSLVSRVTVKNDSGSVIDSNEILTISGGNVDVSSVPSENGTNLLLYNQDIVLDPDWTLHIDTYLQYDNTGNFSSSAITFPLTFNYNDIVLIENSFTVNNFNCYTIPIWEATLRALQLITSKNNILLSEILQRTDSTPNSNAVDGENSLIQITNGFFIRGSEQKDITLSFYGIFKTLDAISNIGMWYNKLTSQFEIKSKIDFYDNATVILTLGEISNLLITVDEENYFSEIETGQNETVDYDVYNGVKEYNTKTKFTTVVDSINKKLNIETKYRTDGMGIIVAKLAGLTSIDSEKTDNYNWFIDCKRSTLTNFESITDENFSSVTNVFEPDKKLNLNFSPKRCLLRNSNRISPCLEFKNSDLKFQESQFNSNLQTQKTGESAAITENENITFAELDDPLFSCILYKFSYPVTALTIKALDANPHGLIEFYYKGVLKSGFLKRVNCDYPNKQGEWLLQKYS